MALTRVTTPVINTTATGNSGQVLTAGTGGNLVWVDQANLAVAGANVTGTVANANYAAFSNLASTANSVAGANVTGTVANATFATSASSANTAATVTTASQPNITSLGTLSNLTTSGDITIGGNLTVNGNTITVHATEIAVDDKNITLAANATTASQANGGGITLAGADATILYISATDTWNFNKNLVGTIANANYATSANVATTANSVAGANVTGTVANATYATSAGSATTAGTVTTEAQPNITSVGTLSNLSVSGTSNLNSVGNITITGGSNGQVLTTNGNGVLSWGNSGNVTPAFAATGSGNTAISVTFTEYQVAYQTEVLDTDGWFANNRFTPQRAGWYQINGSARLLVAGGGTTIEAALRLRKNGATVAFQAGAGLSIATVSQLVFLNGSTDYVDVAISGGATGNVVQTTNQAVFTGSWVRS